MLDESALKEPAPSLVERSALRAMPVEERRPHLKEQADRIADVYQPDPGWQEIAGESFIEY